MADDILLDVAEHIATVTLNRPQVLNAMTPAVMGHLRDAVAEAEAHPDVRVVVFTGAGRGFSSGGDRQFLAEVTRMRPFEIKQTVYAAFSAGIKAVKLCGKPTIAAVNGAAVGAGCELAVACDFRIAAESAVFVENWVHLGIIAPLGGMFLLPQIVGLGAATEMLMLGKRVDAAEALRIGLVREVVPDAGLMHAARALAAQLAEAPPLALGVYKEGLRRGMESTLAAEWEFNIYAQALLLNSQDFAEAVAAVQEKRKPRFQGK
ncbi:MAG TPA: enoyl-CoA hydratase/isomerase family protein [bacterium]|jgi:enoyl-CoA hydratase/carnithine racemase